MRICNLKQLQSKTPNTRLYSRCVLQLKWLWSQFFFIKELGIKFNKDDIEAIPEIKGEYITFNVKISVKLAGVSNKGGKEVRKNIQTKIFNLGS